MDKKELIEKLKQAQGLLKESLLLLEPKDAGESISSANRKEKGKGITSKIGSEVNFNLHARAFFKQYSRGLTGPRNFTLVAAYLTKGEIGISVPTVEIIKCWNKNFSFLGGKRLTSGMHGTRAKESGWLDSKEHGSYELIQDWEKIFD